MEGGLPVEEGNVTIHEVAFHNIPNLQFCC